MMIRPTIAISLLLAAWPVVAAGAEPVPLPAPGLPAGRMDAAGRLVEDWGTVGVRVEGEGIADGVPAVEPLRLDDVLPAARCVTDCGAVRLTLTAYRAPAFPSGVDVLSVRVEEIKGRPSKVTVALDLPEGVKRGLNTAKLDDRVVLSVPRQTLLNQELRPWGYTNETVAMPRWAKPEGECDPAFANIRAGMGGVPICYTFQVPPGSKANVVLGFCESHWSNPGKRPLLCSVEGAAWQDIDPVAAWGQHKPGALVFRAQDIDLDGRLEVAVRPFPGAADRNTILNVIWLFPPGKPPDPSRVTTGALNGSATYYVDVGGPSDQSVYPSTNLEFPLVLPAGGAKELAFFVACPDGAAPLPDLTAWTAEALRQAAVAVWRDWPDSPASPGEER